MSVQVLDAGPIHSADNNSDHSPVYCVVKVKPDLVTENTKSAGSAKPNWSRASQDQKEGFKVKLFELLDKLEVPESVKHCRDVHCSNSDHYNDVDTYITSILGLVEETALLTLPVNRGSQSKNKKPPKPGWSDQVKPYRDTAHFWHQV